MSWNQSNGSEARVCSPRKKEGVVRGIVAAAIVVAGAATAWWFLVSSGDRGAKQAGVRTKALIREVRPAAGQTNAVAGVKKAPKVRPPHVGELRDGYRMLPDGTMHKVHGVITSRTSRTSFACKVFKHGADIALADFILVKPGTGMVGESKDYYRNFEKAFRKALADPIVIEPGDSDEVKDLKQGVIELRAEMKGYMDRGEDLTKILQDERQKLFELSSYRQDLEKQVDAAMREHPEFTEKDLDDLVTAANTMLKERGVTPMKLNKALKNKFKLYQRKARKKE